MNAYNHLPVGVDVYDKDNDYIGVSVDIRARCTVTHPGSIVIKRESGETFWYTGDVEKYLVDTWTLLNYDSPPNGSWPSAGPLP